MGGCIINYVRMLFYSKMMRRSVFVISLLFVSFLSFAQSLNKSVIIEKINMANSQMKSLECSFVQTKHLAIFNDEMVSKGKMYYQQPGELRWEYISPYSYTFILSGNKVLLKNDDRVDVIDVDKNKMFKEIARIMMNSIVGKCISDNSSFDVEIEDSADEFIATLLPLKRDMKQMWTKLLLYFSKENFGVNKVIMYEHSGDYTVITLHDVRQNIPLDDDTFSVE